MTRIEQRVLAYLDQRGPTHRSHIVADLSPDDSRSARHQNGSNGATPLIMGAWCKRLVASGHVEHIVDDHGFYQHHRITDAGKAVVRASDNTNAGV